ncbi:MAG: ATP synthase F1 subunit epsilon [Lentimicrobiaceae bacterium]|nr:ATP synthase F1 subunit epsilon [Lentimicrobiaceae bacterium]
MKVEIITPDKTIFSGEAILVQLPGIDGSFEVLKNHAPLITILKTGEIKIQGKDEKIQMFTINGGVVEVLKNKVLVLAE